MKIYLIRTLGYPLNELRLVHDLLLSFKTSITFEVVDLNPSLSTKSFTEYHASFLCDVGYTEPLDDIILERFSSNDSVQCHKKVHWDRLFEMCGTFRKCFNISTESLVFVLTNEQNTYDWFGGMDKTNKNIFINTSDWKRFIPKASPRLPVAYQIFTYALRSQVVQNLDLNLIDILHPETIGCMNDLCTNKKEIIIKLKTADICADCLDKLLKSNVSKKNILEVLEVFNYIRKQVAYSQGFLRNIELSKLYIDENSDLFLVDYGYIKVKLNPLQKVLYLFLIEHEKGICPQNFYAHKQTLINAYLSLSPQVNLDKMTESINRLCNPKEKTINVEASRIKAEFKKALNLFDDDILEQYIIKANKNGLRTISLNRTLIAYA
jgi:hypothetical protein